MTTRFSRHEKVGRDEFGRWTLRRHAPLHWWNSWWWKLLFAAVCALALFAPCALYGQIAGDSTVMKQLAVWRQSNDYETLACVAASWKDSMLVIDSVLGFRDAPPCPAGTRGVLGNVGLDSTGASLITEEDALVIGGNVLRRFPEFLLACGIHGSKLAAGRYLVPEMWCSYRPRE